MKLIKLTQGQVTMVDDDMYPILNSVRWYAVSTWKKNIFYAIRKITLQNKEQGEYLHHYVLGRPVTGLYVDHINGNSLDNRRFNLRWVTNRENQLNQKKHREGRLPGCTFNGRVWIASIGISGVRKYLGKFPTEIEASQAYMQAFSKIPKKNIYMKALHP